MPSIAEPPTSSASTLSGHRATVVQTPTASPTAAASRAGFFFPSCAVFSIALGVTRFLVRHQAILSINGLAFPIHSEALGERFGAPALRFPRLEIDGFARKLAF